MITWVVAAALAMVQDPQQDSVERQVVRMKEQLTLTDEQTAKVRELLKKSNDDVRALLNDTQKQQLDQSAQRRGGTQGNNNRGGASMPSTEELKAQLSLTDDQVSKINQIRDDSRQQIREYFRDQPRGNNGSREDFAAAMQKMREESNGKIRGALTDEQKPKFDDIVKNFQAQLNAAPTPGGTFGRGGSIDDRVARVMENLKVEDAKESEAVKGVVKKVMALMDKVEAAQRDGRSKVDEASRNQDLSDDAVGDRIAEVLRAIRDAEKELSTARKELTDVVTNRQELELLRRGVLR